MSQRSTQAASGALVLAAALLLGTPVFSQTTWYVDAAAAGPGTGSQSDPYSSLQVAVGAASTVSGDSLLVATGIYLESLDLLGKDLLIDGSSAAPLPVLDAGGVGSTLLLNGGETAACTLRGLVVRGGAGTDRGGRTYGGGALIEGASPTLEQVRFETGSAESGGGVAVLSGSPVFIDCTFASNDAKLGGGLFVENASVSVTGGSFEFNSARPQFAQAYGGGAFIGSGATADFDSVRFEGNETEQGGGGGLHTTSTSLGTHARLCEFVSNSPGTFNAPGQGGGVFARGPFAAEECEFSENGAAFPDGVFGGGGAFGGEYTECRFIGNSGQLGGGLRAGSATDCLFERNQGCADGGGQGGGAHSSTLLRCVLERNSTCGEGGGAYGGTLVDCDVRFNVARSSDNGPGVGGGLYQCTATATRIQGNISQGDFGGSFVSRAGGAMLSQLERCEVTGNIADDAGGVLGGSADRCSIVGNFARSSNGGVTGGQYDSCIVWHNLPATIGGNATFSYSNVGPFLPAGVGNLSIDPLLVTASGADVHLLAGSTCIDSGSPMAPLDPDGTRADMGALPFDPSWLTGPAAYCSPTPTLAGCMASVGAMGPASLGAGLTVIADGVPSLTFGLFFLGTQPNAQLVAGTGSSLPNTLCVGGAVRRTAVVQSSPSSIPCGGVFTKFVTPADILTAGGQPGSALFGQFWFRQPGSTSSFPRSAMSNGIYLPLLP
ncbi:hypothetical protein Poly30_44810 [Planctomycetes bacterium Poly30]|uniref:Right handed beta helix domain-containing protein n=1 Tax=Saltatorellus ferox TaxID=2528018 RepID=A0A518EXV6_9BACT|nr:hypothetical protein Poly30_44810 [Planctomycetes bacterium Poly30]